MEVVSSREYNVKDKEDLFEKFFRNSDDSERKKKWDVDNKIREFNVYI